VLIASHVNRTDANEAQGGGDHLGDAGHCNRPWSASCPLQERDSPDQNDCEDFESGKRIGDVGRTSPRSEDLFRKCVDRSL